MASYQYRIMVDLQDGPFEQTHGGPWTHAKATTWARTEGALLPIDTTFRVERRRCDGARRGADKSWLSHRAYVVGPDGIVRRTDR